MDDVTKKLHESLICREYAVHILLGYIYDNAFRRGIDKVIKDTKASDIHDMALALCLCDDWEIWNDNRMKLFNTKE